MVPPQRAEVRPAQEESTLLIDATLKHTAPPLALPTRDYMERARAIWQDLQLPPLTPQPPWHGYSLGDWSERWDVYAARAVAGRWRRAASRRSRAAAAASRRRRRCARWRERSS